MRKAFSILLLLASLLATTAAAQMKSGGSASTRDSLFLDAAIDNRTPYVGQEVILTYSLYFVNIAPRIVDTGKAEHPGLWAQEVTPEGYIKSTPATVGGKSFKKAVVKQLKLLPMQAGNLSVSNYRLRCFLPSNTGIGKEGSRDIETVITAPTTVIVAKPLPKGAPEGFNGAVGDFSIELSSNRFQVHAGEPLTLAIKISGRGNLKEFPQVALKLPEGFRQAETSVPTVTRENSGREGEAVSSKITLISDHAGSTRFTPIRLTAFNPWKVGYETISSEQIAITVLPAEKTPQQSSPDSISPAPPDRSAWLPPAAMISMAIAVLLFVALFFLFAGKHRKKRPAQIEITPDQPQMTAAPQTPESAESLRGRLYEALGKAGIQNPAGLTSQQLKMALTGLKVKPECAEALLEFMKMIDHAVYTPGKTSREALEKLNRKASSVFEALSDGCES
jgi:hypothetical protein